MKRLAIAVVAALPLVLALLLAACDGDGGAPSASTPTRTPPPDPAERFEELEDLRKAATFHVIYRLETGRDVPDEQFAWLQDGERARWDDVYIMAKLGVPAGSSSIDDGAGSGLSCIWGVDESGAKVIIMCSPGPRGGPLTFTDTAINGYFRPSDLIEFRSYGNVLGVPVECFSLDTYDLSGHICLSPQGVPLQILSAVSGASWYSYSLAAVEIRPPPSEEELLTPIIPDAPLGQEVTLRDIPLDDLVLPDMPIIEDFFDEEEE